MALTPSLINKNFQETIKLSVTAFNTTTETLTVASGTYVIGTPLTPSAAFAGLSVGTTYYIYANVTGTAIKLTLTPGGGGTVVNLSGVSGAGTLVYVAPIIGPSISTTGTCFGFDPRAIPGCILWLDAQNPNNVTTDINSSVTLWDDLSANSVGNMAGSSNNPTYSSNKIAFSTNEYLVGSTGSVGELNSNDFAIFAVATVPVSTLNTGQYILSKYAASISWRLYFTYTSPNHYVNFSYYDGSTTYTVTSNAVTAGGTIIISLIAPRLGSMKIYNNGNASTGVTNAATLLTNGAALYIGVYGASLSNYLTASVGEILIYSSSTASSTTSTAISSQQQSQIEGYLAYKWGVTLPTSEIYNINNPLNILNVPKPFLIPFRPPDIANCLLWLDGLDSSTISTSTNGIVWLDKSGQNNNASAYASSTGSYADNYTYNNTTLATTGIYFPSQTVTSCSFTLVLVTGGSTRTATLTVTSPNSTANFKQGNDVLISGSQSGINGVHTILTSSQSVGGTITYTTTAPTPADGTYVGTMSTNHIFNYVTTDFSDLSLMTIPLYVTIDPTIFTTIFVACNPTYIVPHINGTSFDVIFGYSGWTTNVPQNPYLRIYNSPTDEFLLVQANGSQISTTVNVNLNSIHIATTVFSGTDTTLFANNQVQYGTTSSMVGYPSYNLLLGGNSTDNRSNWYQGYEGYINEVIMYQGTSGLSDGEIQQVQGYLAWKWGYPQTTNLVPSTHSFTKFPSATVVPY